MADYSELKAAIRAAIYDNTEQAITGEVLQDILVEMVDALGVPEGGIPASELTQAVQQALEKALSAYQKPGTGIPASDIADGVIPDVSQFITKTVTDLVHYYTKEETYTQAQVNDLIGAISQFHYEIYASLEDITSPASNVLYLIGPSGSGSDQYEEYVYTNGAFTKIGDTSIDLSGYLRYTPQTLTEEEKAQARQNIGAGTSSFSGDYKDLLNKPTIPTVPAISTDITADRESDAKTASPKAVANALGKWGVVSQAQTWIGSSATGWDYTMDNLERGIIPQANIDLFVAAGALFNSATGYFEIGDMTDISYQEMIVIYNQTNPLITRRADRQQNLNSLAQGDARATLFLVGATGLVVNMSYFAYYSSYIEEINIVGVFFVNNANNALNAFTQCNRLRKINGLLHLNYSSSGEISIFGNCYSLEDIQIGRIKGSFTFKYSPRLSLDSVVFMVEKAENTTAITITLHATAYARCQADTTEYTYNGQTYTGILAYASAKNITIASA